jgi:uncharacterized protein YceH (UPF0502 family)
VLLLKRNRPPESHPLSLNALSCACNQIKSRSVVHLEESEIQRSIIRGINRSCVPSVDPIAALPNSTPSSGRFQFYRPEVAIICELLLRGPQTRGANTLSRAILTT